MIDVSKILDEQFGQQSSLVDGAFGEQENALRSQVGSFASNLKQQLEMERKFILDTPMDGVQRESKLRALNQKYEMQALKLEQEMSPHFTELQQKKAAAMSKLQAQYQEGQQRLGIVQSLIDSGRVAPGQEHLVLQEQLQAVGINVPAEMFRGPKPRTLAEVEAERRAIESELGKFRAPGKKGKEGPRFQRDGSLQRYIQFSPDGSFESRRQASPEEQEYGNMLVARMRELESERTALATEGSTNPLVGRFRQSMQTAAGTTPFAKNVASQVRSPTPARQAQSDPLGLGL